ncbi:VWA domain-containing protein [Desulfobacula toluolica]|uniref:von Willebrand factor, tetratricopeptide domain protein n=1 Tax=Desulfobacula toluolica (strain DSM 7467 / Tol2) TaxID=651182 RepID=K0NIS0_DESTT|nr:VWA domain-containing protein [Desulfobacula toluolica]CCK79708.1 von Willebrand factor, tetratricopeptide domain protein [Desulfobacula toluolica Tol2]
MKFAHPYLLNLLWTLIPVFGIMVYGILKRKKILSEFAGANMFSSIIPGFDPKRRWIKAVLILLASGFAIVALAGPQLGYRWEKTTQKGVDIIIALDCSKSMLAQDIKPNRLERAKREIVDLLRMMKSDRAGLVAFSGRAILQCPLTLDHEAFNVFLKVLEPGFLPVGGTNLDAAVTTSYSGFEKESDTEKAIIIITDGENTSGDVEETAKEMLKQGIKIFCIGVGDLQGAPIPDENGGFKKDASGNIVLSRVDEQGLEKLAAMTGGAYVRSVAGDMDLDVIYKDKILGTMERKTLTSGKKKVWENRYQWFLFPCLVLLLMEFVLSSKRKSHRWFVVIVAFSLSLFSAQTVPVYAKTVSSSVKQGIQAYEEQKYEQAKKHFIDAQLERPDNETLYYNIGAAAYMNKEYEHALKNFTEAARSEDVNLRHNAQYNLANTQYQMGNFNEAIKGYEAVLKKFPDDNDAKENLALAKQKKQEQEQQKSNPDKDGDDKNKDKQNNQDKQNTEGLDKNQEQEKNQNQNQNKNQNQQQDKPSSEHQQGDNPGETPSQAQDKKTQQAKGNETAASEDNQQQKQADQAMENMLNRLEDKPGSAMMPVIEERHIEKDW